VGWQIVTEVRKGEKEREFLEDKDSVDVSVLTRQQALHVEIHHHQ